MIMRLWIVRVAHEECEGDRIVEEDDQAAGMGGNQIGVLGWAGWGRQDHDVTAGRQNLFLDFSNR